MVDFRMSLLSRRRPSAGRPESIRSALMLDSTAVPIINYSDAMSAQQAMAHPVVRRAVTIIAEASSQVEFLVQPLSRVSSETVEGIRRVLEEPTPDMTGDQLMHWIAQNLALYGRAAVKVDLESTRPFVPSAIFPLETEGVRAIRDERGNTVSYEVGPVGRAALYPSYWRWRLMGDMPERPMFFVYEFWRPTLSGFRNSQETNTPLASIGMPARIITSLMLRALSTAEGHPNARYLLYTSATLSGDQTTGLKQYVNDQHATHGEHSGRALLLDSLPDLSVIKLDNDLSDVHSKTPIDDMTRMIFGAFRIPVALAGLGAADAAKYAQNYRESRATFWEDTILPGYVKPVAKGFKQFLGNGVVDVYPNLETVPSMIEGRAFAMAAVDQVRFLTPNEKRAMFGRSAHEDGEGLDDGGGDGRGVSNQVLS